MTAEDGIKWELAKFAWEAGESLSLAERTAIMFIIRNRVGTGEWLKELHEIRFKTLLLNPRAWPDIRDPQFKDVLEVVDSIYDGTRTDNLTQGGTHWTLPEQPIWFATREQVGRVGALTIWK